MSARYVPSSPWGGAIYVGSTLITRCPAAEAGTIMADLRARGQG